MRRRGFTLIEVVIVMSLVALLTAPLLDFAVSFYRHGEAMARQSDLKAEAEGMAWRLFRRGAPRLHPDNQGATFPDGSEVRRRRDDVVLRTPQGERALNEHPVEDFTLHRRDGVLVLHLRLRAPLHARGPEAGRDFFFDRAEQGEP